MTTIRRRWHISALAAAALIVAGCGGGDTDAPLAKRVIVFGDSVSDVGTYTPATQIPLGQDPGVPPFFGGKFTTNSHTGYTATNNTSNANVWVELDCRAPGRGDHSGRGGLRHDASAVPGRGEPGTGRQLHRLRTGRRSRH